MSQKIYFYYALPAILQLLVYVSLLGMTSYKKLQSLLPPRNMRMLSMIIFVRFDKEDKFITFITMNNLCSCSKFTYFYRMIRTVTFVTCASS